MAEPLPDALILASGSRFRRQMLENVGLIFSVVPADVDEVALRDALTRQSPAASPTDIALALAREKALQISQLNTTAIVIGADQLLEMDGVIFAKPRDTDEARRQLSSFRGKPHTLPTAVVLARGDKIIWQHVDCPRVTMRQFSADALEGYLAAEGPAVTETVGGYKIEGRGGQLFERIDGDYFSVIGVPLLPLLAQLRVLGVLQS